jgi:hypothetical protein
MKINEKSEQISIRFFGLSFQFTNPTNKSILILVLLIILLLILVFAFKIYALPILRLIPGKSILKLLSMKFKFINQLFKNGSP